VTAHVASDLVAANSFYRSHGLKEALRREGGKSTKRELIIRVLDLDTPNLFNYGAAESKRLILGSPSYSASPRYLLDLNVFFDVVKKRTDEELSSKLFGLSFKGFLRLAVAQEFISELERKSAEIPNDVVLNFAKSLPLVQRAKRPISENLLVDLAELIFHQRAHNNTAYCNRDLRRIERLHHSRKSDPGKRRLDTRQIRC
jgi:hypothetical protein